MDDHDAMWKPGYDGPPPTFGSTPEHATEPSPVQTDRDEPVEQSSRRWPVALGVALGLVLVAAVVVLDPLGSSDESTGAVLERPDPSVFGGPAARRLPAAASPLWSVELESSGDHWVDVIGRELVIAAVMEPMGTPLDVDVPAAPVTTIVALDAPTGQQRWTLQLTADPRDVTVVGAVDDVLVLEQRGEVGPIVIGVDVATGETSWSTDAVPNAGHVGLVGTSFVARLPPASERLVALIDTASGREVGTIVSDPVATGQPGGWSTDQRGTWYVIDDGDVVEYDLRTQLGEATIIGRVDDVSRPLIVVDDRLVSVADSGSVSLEAGAALSPLTVSAEVPVPVRSLTSVSGSNFVVTGPGAIAGVSVDGDGVNATWSQNEGAVVDEHPIEGGMLLQVATSGGAEMRLVDGLTGETIEHLTMMPGALQALVVAGDGIVALGTSELGTELTGIDLDGTERWTIAGSAPVVVGDRITVRTTSSDVIREDATSPSRQLRLTVYGDVE